MTIGRCGDCKHWNRKNLRGGRWAVCYAIDDDYEARRSGFDGAERAFTQSTGYHDGSMLVTRDDFGCVLFEPKEES